MSALVLGPEEIQALKSLREYAESNPMNMDDLLDIINGDPAAGDFDEFTRYIPVGFKVVYSIEQQLPGDIRHLSVSCEKQAPPPEAVEVIKEHLGFINNPGFTQIFKEDIGEGRIAINLLQLIPGSPDRRA